MFNLVWLKMIHTNNKSKYPFVSEETSTANTNACKQINNDFVIIIISSRLFILFPIVYEFYGN